MCHTWEEVLDWDGERGSETDAGETVDADVETADAGGPPTASDGAA